MNIHVRTFMHTCNICVHTYTHGHSFMYVTRFMLIEYMYSTLPSLVKLQVEPHLHVNNPAL